MVVYASTMPKIAYVDLDTLADSVRDRSIHKEQHMVHKECIQVRQFHVRIIIRPHNLGIQTPIHHQLEIDTLHQDTGQRIRNHRHHLHRLLHHHRETPIHTHIHIRLTLTHIRQGLAQSGLLRVPQHRQEIKETEDPVSTLYFILGRFN